MAAGVTDGKRPLEVATREEAAIMVLRGMRREQNPTRMEF